MSQNAERPKGQRTTVSRKGRQARKQDGNLYEKLLAAIKNMNCIISILIGMVGFRFDEKQKSGIQKVKHYARNQANTAIAKRETDENGLIQTAGLANNVTNDLYDLFESFVQGSFEHFDNMMQKIRSLEPQILVREADTIANLQEVLRKLLDASAQETSYEEIAAAYTAVANYLQGLSAEAEQVALDRRKEQESKLGFEIIEAIEGLVAV